MDGVLAVIRRYRGVGAVRRAGRAAIVMPAMFAIGDKVIGNPTIATFAAFGSFAMVLLVDFGGTMRNRLESQLTLALAGVTLLVIGTVASRQVWIAVPVAVVVAFVVLFVGVVSSVLAGATTSLLLSFVLPISTPGPLSSLPDRLAGWGLAGGAAMVAAVVLWPAPEQDPLRTAAERACRALAVRLRADVDYRVAGCPQHLQAEHQQAVTAATEAVHALHQAFITAPYRPTGLSTSARATVRLIDELTWTDVILTQSLPPIASSPAAKSSMRVKQVAADVLVAGADLLRDPRGSVTGLNDSVAALDVALGEMEQRATVDLPTTRPTDEPGSSEFVTSLEPTFRAQEVSFAVGLIGQNIARVAVAERRGWWDRLLGHQPDGLRGRLSSAQERAGAHLDRHSVWLHNSLRGAAALALAVLVADKTGVQHSFWVVFGTLSVLRSNALNTGQNALRGVLGTSVGFAIGAGLIELIGTNQTALWLLLPLAVLMAGAAPALVSFAAGQAAFTVTLVILYNLVQPAGWRLGLVRVEDVALGCGVSLAVGLLFWPRGAAASLRTALAQAYDESADYLDEAVTYGALRCDQLSPEAKAPAAEAARAASASRRLDDTFRNYLAERGPKPVSLADMTSLVTGVAALRLAADAIVDLWQRDHEPAAGDRTAARAELREASVAVRQWYDDLAMSLIDRHEPRAPLEHDKVADRRLIEAVRQDLGADDGSSTGSAVRVIWTADHLDAARRLQQLVVDPARAAISRR